MFRKKSFIVYLLLFILLNIALYSFIACFHNQAIFQEQSYLYNTHHFFQDDRAYGGGFNLLRALGNYDAQWYLRIAQAGYPNASLMAANPSPYYMGGLSYAFFPLYPLLISLFNLTINHTELTAFILANALMVANFVSVYYIITKLYSEEIALKTNFLLFLFPFSIFFRSYFTEGLFLLLLLWFSYFLIRKNLLLTTLCIALLYITRPNGLFLSIIYLGFLFWNIKKKKFRISEVITALIISILPLVGWIYFNYLQTGNPLMWYSVQSVWYKAKYLLQPIFDNGKEIATFWFLPFHSYHQSKIDTLVMISSISLVAFARKFLKKELWFIAIVLTIVPLLIKDTMSYTRYQSVAFPIFVYIAGASNKYIYATILTLFTVGLFITTLFFVNWYWIG